jgi:hypothetical protein
MKGIPGYVIKTAPQQDEVSRKVVAHKYGVAGKKAARGWVIEGAEAAQAGENRKRGRASWFERREMQTRMVKSDSQIARVDAYAASRCLRAGSAGDKGSAAAEARGEAGGRGRTGRTVEAAAAARPAHAEGAMALARDAYSPEDR